MPTDQPVGAPPPQTRWRNQPAVLLFALAAVKGVLFAVCIPLGQGPDESAHVAYVLFFVRHPSFQAVQQGQDDLVVQQAIFDVLTRERCWELIQDDVEFGRHHLSRPPQSLDELTYLAGYVMEIRHHISPVFFFLAAQPIRWFSIDSLWGQWIFLRLLCVGLGLGVIGLTYAMAKTVLPEEPLVALAAAAYVAFLPQAAFLSAVVSPDSLLIFVATASLYAACRIVQGKHQLLWSCSLIVLCSLCVFTKRAGVASLIFAIWAVPLLFPDLIPRLKAWPTLSSFVGGTLVLGVLGIITYPSTGLHGTGLYGVLVGRIVEVLSRLQQGLLLPSLPDVLRGGAIVFVSFWFSYSWMIYKMALGWYGLFAGVSLLAGWGILKTAFRQTSGVKLRLLAVLGLFLGTYVLSVIVLVISSQQVDIVQGRHLMPAIAAVAILLTMGIRGVVPNVHRQLALQLLIVCMVGLNVVVVGKYLLPLFYLA